MSRGPFGDPDAASSVPEPVVSLATLPLSSLGNRAGQAIAALAPLAHHARVSPPSAAFSDPAD
ncbi:hypothetical protein GCM10027053_20240 [Intrasporangium mesophilum]